MQKRVLICAKGCTAIAEQWFDAEMLAKQEGATVIDISRCSLQELVHIVEEYARLSVMDELGICGAIGTFWTNNKDYVIDTNDEDWWFSQVGK